MKITTYLLLEKINQQEPTSDDSNHGDTMDITMLNHAFAVLIAFVEVNVILAATSDPQLYDLHNLKCWT